MIVQANKETATVGFTYDCGIKRSYSVDADGGINYLIVTADKDWQRHGTKCDPCRIASARGTVTLAGKSVPERAQFLPALTSVIDVTSLLVSA